MSLRGAATLGVWHGVVPGQERATEDWYNREHHAERVAIPGFLRARRYVNLGQGLRYFSRYDVTAPAVLASAPYLGALNSPSPWSQQIFPTYRDTVRGVFNVVRRLGNGDGGSVVAWRIPSHAVQRHADIEITLEQAAEKVVRSFGVVGLEVWSVDAASTLQPTREKELRSATDDFPAYAMIVDVSDPAAGREAVTAAGLDSLFEGAAIDTLQLQLQLNAESAAIFTT